MPKITVDSASETMAVSHRGEGKGTSRSGRKIAWESFSKYYSLAFEMAIAVIAPMLFGWWLDSRTGKGPWFTIGGMILGAAAVFRSVQRVVAESLRNQKKNEESSDQESSE